MEYINRKLYERKAMSTTEIVEGDIHLDDVGGWETMNRAVALGHSLEIPADENKDGSGPGLERGTKVLNALGVEVGNEHCNGGIDGGPIGASR